MVHSAPFCAGSRTIDVYRLLTTTVVGDYAWGEMAPTVGPLRPGERRAGFRTPRLGANGSHVRESVRSGKSLKATAAAGLRYLEVSVRPRRKVDPRVAG